MGKGRIVSGGTNGLYTVELLHNRDRIDAEIEFLAAQLSELQAELDALNTERDDLVAQRNAIATDIDTAIANAEEGEIPGVEALLAELAQVSAQIQSQDVRIALVKGRRLEARKRKEMLESVPANPQQQAWCADFTESLTGEVATIEVPAEGVVGQFLTWRRAQIRPGHSGRATYNAARDGQMFHRQGQVGYQAYFNAAILPGVQRWKPQYRIGVITSISYSADTCSLTIQGEDSSAQSLIIDPPDLQYSKTGVPIEYMDCNSDPFEIGDRVLVEFQGRDWDQPKVIGFESNPRECRDDWPPVYYILRSRGDEIYNNGPYDLRFGPQTGTCSTGGGTSTYTGWQMILGTKPTDRALRRYLVAELSTFRTHASLSVVGGGEYEVWEGDQLQNPTAKVATPVGYDINTFGGDSFSIKKNIYGRTMAGDIAPIIVGSTPPCDDLPTDEIWTPPFLTATETIFDSQDEQEFFDFFSPGMPATITVENSDEPDEPARVYALTEAVRIDPIGIAAETYLVYRQQEEE